MAPELSLAHRWHCVAGHFRRHEAHHTRAHTPTNTAHTRAHTHTAHTRTHTHDSMIVRATAAGDVTTYQMCLSTPCVRRTLLFYKVLARAPYTPCSPSTDSLHSLHTPCAVVNTCIQRVLTPPEPWAPAPWTKGCWEEYWGLLRTPGGETPTIRLHTCINP